MTDARTRLMALLEPAVEALGYELVDLEANIGGKGGLLRLYIDLPPGRPRPAVAEGFELAAGDGSGIQLEDCEAVSRQVSGILDVEDPIQGEYNLEVSSPGLDRKLVKPAHFDRFAGRAVKGRLRRMVDGRRRFTGTLLRREDDAVLVLVDGREMRFSLADLEVVRLVPEF
jgi:ribosome maturation factor RimP